MSKLYKRLKENTSNETFTDDDILLNDLSNSLSNSNPQSNPFDDHYHDTFNNFDDSEDDLFIDQDTPDSSKPTTAIEDHTSTAHDDQQHQRVYFYHDKDDELITFDTTQYKLPNSALLGNRLLYFTSIFVSLGVFMFGYDQGVCSGIITFPQFIKYFNHPTSSEIGFVVSILEIGAMVSSLLVGKISNYIGRKPIILIGSFIFIIGGTLQTFSNNLVWFGLGRIISGLGIGLLSTVVPIYQSEISPSHERGRLACIEFTGNILGYSASVWVDYMCSFLGGDKSWRIPLFVQCILGVILFCGSFYIVESPRWLLDHDFDEKGFEVLNFFHCNSDVEDLSKKEFKTIKRSILIERELAPLDQRTYRVIFSRYYKRLLLSISALMFSQLNGINIISYYAPMVFEEAGFKDSKALLVTGINSLVYLASTIPPWFLVDKWGRKPILISGGFIMGVCLSLVSVVMWLDKSFTPMLVAGLVIVYNASFGYSWGPVAWMLPPEYLPLSIRSLGCSLSTGIGNWLFNYVVGQMTPILQEDWGWKMYLIPASSCFISIVVVFFLYPETKGIELEDMDKLFDDNPLDVYKSLNEQEFEP